MDTLHTVLRTIRRESKARRDHLEVFREFIGHLDRLGRRAIARPPAGKRDKAVKRRGK